LALEKYYPWLLEVKDYITGINAIQKKAYDPFLPHFDNVIISNHFFDLTDMGEYKDMKEDLVICPHQFKTWKHIDKFVTAVPQIKHKVEIYNGGIEYHYMSGTKRKEKYKNAKGEWIWDKAVEHGMEYKGFVDDISIPYKRCKAIIDLSVGELGSKLSKQHNYKSLNQVPLLAMKYGAVPIVRDYSLLPDIITEDNVVLVDEKDLINSAAKTVNEVIDNFDSYDDMIKRNFKLLKKHYNRVDNAKKLLSLLETKGEKKEKPKVSFPETKISSNDFLSVFDEKPVIKTRNIAKDPFCIKVELTEGCNKRCPQCFGYLGKGRSYIPKVYTMKGKKSIWDVNIGEEIVTMSDEGKLVKTKVFDKIKRSAKGIYKITFENGQKLAVTGEHPFFVRGKWKKVSDLEKGDEVYNFNWKECLDFIQSEKIRKLNKLRAFVSNGVKIKNIEFLKQRELIVWNLKCKPYDSYICNYFLVHNCGIHSIRGKERNWRFLSVELADKISKELNEWMPNGKRIEFSLQGEPLLNPEANNIFSTFRKNYPKCQMLTYSNGIELFVDGEVSLEFIKSKFDSGLNYLIIDIYEKTPEFWKEKLEELDIPIRELHEDGFNPWLYRGPEKKGIILIDNHNEEMWSKTNLRKLNNQAGNMPIKMQEKYGLKIDKPLNKRCVNVFRELVIKYDGAVSLCCMNWQRKNLIGNIQQNSIKELWQSDKFDAIRQLLYDKKRLFEPCNKCSHQGSRVGLLQDPNISKSEEELLEIIKEK